MKRNQSDREKIIRAVHAAKGSFRVAPKPEGKWKLAKRLGRKLTFWYVQPFGAAQNAYNEAAADAITMLHERDFAMQGQIAAQDEQIALLDRRIAALHAQISVLEKQLEASEQRTVKRMDSLRQEQLGIVTQETAAREAMMKAMAEQIDREFRNCAPDARSTAGVLPLTRIQVNDSDALPQLFRAVQQAKGEAEMQEALGSLSADYQAILRAAMRNQTQPKIQKPIVLVCKRFDSTAGMEAIRNELWDLYTLLRHASRYPAWILSIEPSDAHAEVRGDVHYVPENELRDWMQQNDPALLVFCESTTSILDADQHSLLLRNAVVRLSAQNPARLLGGSKMQELLHLCDLGVQHYCVASAYAADVMEHHGFRRPVVLYPYIDIHKRMFFRKPRPFDAARFTVGFASSPMLPEQAASRGIPLLCETVQQNPDIRFLILWRDAEAVAIPDELESAPNCEIRTGRCDMAQFYNEIDCVLIPYTDENYNHACPLSALEGMLMGIPTVSTPAAGISELIAICGIGITAAAADADALSDALRQIPQCYPAFQAAWRTEQLRELLSGKDFVRYLEECIEDAVPQGVHTLYEWDRQLKAAGKHLQKGHAALKAYYQRQEVASGYTAERFETYPQNCFDLMERKSVSVLLEHFLGGKEHAELLDLACGNGRILQELLPFGHCTAGDASPAMLELIRKRFPDADLTVTELDLLDGAPEGTYDAITIFRFLRHYEYGTRKKLWARLRAALNPNGVLLFDVPNVRFEVPHREKNGWGNYHIYDVFWTRRAIEKELSDNGLCLRALVPVGQGLYPLPDAYRDEPMTWTAAVSPI